MEQRSCLSSPVFKPPITTPSAFMAETLAQARARLSKELPPCTAANTAALRREGRERRSASCCCCHWLDLSMLLRVRLLPPLETLAISSESMNTTSGAATAASSVHSASDTRTVPEDDGRET
jgi:hypothetical protein